MSEQDHTESVVFGDFSSDEVQSLYDIKETAVMFSTLVSTKTSEGHVTHNHTTNSSDDRKVSQTGGTSSPEFQFSLPPSGSDYAQSCQFGSPASTLAISSTTSPSSLSTANSSSSLNSTQSGRNQNRLNVFAKEFVPNYPSHLSIISKGEGAAVVGGAYPVPPIATIPPPFLMPPYAPPVVFIDPRFHHQPLPLQTMGHASTGGIRPSGGPQVAVVAPYRAAHEPRPMMVLPEKSYNSEERIPSVSDSSIDISHVKSLSLSPPIQPTASSSLTPRSSSTGDIRAETVGGDLSDTPAISTTPTDVADVVESKQRSPTPPTQPDVDTPPSRQSPVHRSPCDSPSHVSQSPAPDTPPHDKSASPTGLPQSPLPATSQTSSSPLPDSPSHITPPQTSTHAVTTPPPLVTTPTKSSSDEKLISCSSDSSIGNEEKTSNNEKLDTPDGVPHPLDKPHPPEDTNDQIVSSNIKPLSPNEKPLPLDGKPLPSNDKSSDKLLSPNDKSFPPNDKPLPPTTNLCKKQTTSNSTRSWAAVVGTSSQMIPPPFVPRADMPTHKVGVASKTAAGAAAEVLSKEELMKIEERKLERLKFFGKQIEGLSLNHSPASILPRGLTNTSNMCYIHAPLQALISCPELTNLLRYLQLPKMSDSDPSSLATIVTENMIRFIGKFQTYPNRIITVDANGRRKKNPRDFSYEKPFKPDFIYEILPRIKSPLSIQGRQEDAEEFLGCFLNKLHEELVAAREAIATPTTATDDAPKVKTGDNERDGGEEDEEEWQEVGPKNKSTITRQTEYMESPISEIFGGRLHSSLHRQGMKVSATVEPFFSLQLDIQSDSIKSVKDALDLLATKETINLSEKDGIGATRRMTLIHLPHVLILHLKRFVFDGSKCHKLLKNINYDPELEIPKELLAPSVKGKLSTSQRSYKLWAVVHHCGESPNNGHYICEAYHPQYGGWLRYDDNYVKPTNSEQLFRLAHRVPYLFFYRQVDTVHGGRN